MKQVPIKLGPLSLLLTVISICLSTLAILNFNTARADLRLAEKYAETVRVRYELESQAQEYLGALDNGGAAIETPDENGVSWRVFELDGSYLRVGIILENGEYSVVAWRHGKEWTQDGHIENLWSGFGF